VIAGPCTVAEKAVSQKLGVLSRIEIIPMLLDLIFGCFAQKGVPDLPNLGNSALTWGSGCDPSAVVMENEKRM